MLLTLTTTHQPATNIGYLLHKNPTKLQTFELSFGKAHVFYPEATAERCTAALLLDVDPVGLVRGRKGPPGDQLDPDEAAEVRGQGESLETRAGETLTLDGTLQSR